MRVANHTPASSPPAALAWAPYAACAWAWLFALASFYWAAGGRWGLDTLGNGIQAQVHDPAFIAVVWLTGFVKVVAGFGALTLARPWLLWMPRAIKLVATWSGGAGLALYGSIQIIVGALVLGNLLRPTGPVDWSGLRWHVLLWDPWWALGGLLFLLAAWYFQRSPASAVPHR